MRLIDNGNEYILEIVDEIISKYEMWDLIRCFRGENDLLLFAYMNISAERIIDNAKEIKSKHHLSDELFVINESNIRNSIYNNEKFVYCRKIFVNSEQANPQVRGVKEGGRLTTWFRCKNKNEELNELGKNNFCCIIIEAGNEYEMYKYKISEIEIDDGRALVIDTNKKKAQFKVIYDRICMKFKTGLEMA